MRKILILFLWIFFSFHLASSDSPPEDPLTQKARDCSLLTFDNDPMVDIFLDWLAANCHRSDCLISLERPFLLSRTSYYPLTVISPFVISAFHDTRYCVGRALYSAMTPSQRSRPTFPVTAQAPNLDPLYKAMNFPLPAGELQRLFDSV